MTLGEFIFGRRPDAARLDGLKVIEAPPSGARLRKVRPKPGAVVRAEPALKDGAVETEQGELHYQANRDCVIEYDDGGRAVVRADISRKVEGRKVLILDDVFDSGRTIAFAKAHLAAKGATEVRACAFIRKPAAGDAPIEHVGLDCPDRYLIGYGMDDAGRYRGLPYVGALD